MQLPIKKLYILSTIFMAGYIIAGAKNISSKNNFPGKESAANAAVTAAAAAEKTISALYTDLHLRDAGLDENVFIKALNGLQKLNNEGAVKKDDLITIVDFSQPSNKKRLYVIDLENRRMLFNTLVAHGRNSGTLWAKSFSNSPSSHKSSPGFYSTAETYRGENGYSLRLDGLEKNINSNARCRAIVMHGAGYVNPSAAHSRGYIGRSWGCPAVPVNEHRQIINTIKDGTCLFIFSPDPGYIASSSLVNTNLEYNM